MQKVYFLLLASSLFLFSNGQQHESKTLAMLCVDAVKKHGLYHNPKFKELLKINDFPALNGFKQEINTFWVKCSFFDEKIVYSKPSWQQLLTLKNIEQATCSYKVYPLVHRDYTFMHLISNNSILIVGPAKKMEIPCAAKQIKHITVFNDEKIFFTSDFIDSEDKKFIIHHYVDLKKGETTQKRFSHANDSYSFPITPDTILRIPSDKSSIEEIYENKQNRIFACKNNEKISLIPNTIGSKYIPFVTSTAQKKSLYFLDLQKPYETQVILEGYKQIDICEHYSSSLLICCTDDGIFHFIDIKDPQKRFEQKITVPLYSKGRLHNKSSFFYDEKHELLYAQKKSSEPIYVFSLAKDSNEFYQLTRFIVDKSRVVQGGPIVKNYAANKRFRVFTSLQVFQFVINSKFNENIENALQYYEIKNDSKQFDLFKKVLSSSVKKMKLLVEEKKIIAAWPHELIKTIETKNKSSTIFD